MSSPGLSTNISTSDRFFYKRSLPSTIIKESNGFAAYIFCAIMTQVSKYSMLAYLFMEIYQQQQQQYII